jgi:putative holliday junction resolvase
MSRILAIDFGSKRCGIAVTDSLQMIGTGLKTIAPEELIPFLKKYTSEEEVECLVVGEPLQKDGTASSIETEIQAFLKKLKTTLPELKINRYDERFTSKMAFQSMIDSGLKKKARQNKALVDEISATIILNDYLEFRKSQARNG